MGGSTTVQAPAPIDPATVGRESLQAQIDLAPQQFAAESQYAPQYAALYQGIASNLLPQMLASYSQQAPAISDLQAQLNRAQRTADIGDVQNLGQQATAAFQQANPQLMQLQQTATDRALSGGSPIQGLGAAPQFSQQGLPNQIQAQQLGGGPQISAGQNPLLGMMGMQAAEGLMSGGQLSQQDVSGIANQVASQYNLMGRAQDPIASATAALNLDAAQRARMQAAQQYAGNVAGMFSQQQGLGLQAQQAQGQLGLGYGSADQQAALQAAQSNLQAQQANQQLNLQAQQLGAQYGLGYGQANQQADYQNAILQQQQLGQASALAAQTAQDPYSLILGRSGGFGQLAGLNSMANQYPTSTQNFNPFNNQIMDIYSGNQATQLGANVATANANAAKTAGIMQGLGSAAGGLMGGAGVAGAAGKTIWSGFCWVAREVYGAENPAWVVFRHWMLHQSPAWFRNLYLKHGEAFAAFIKNKPMLKNVIRRWMDSRIANMEVA